MKKTKPNDWSGSCTVWSEKILADHVLKNTTIPFMVIALASEHLGKTYDLKEKKRLMSR